MEQNQMTNEYLQAVRVIKQAILESQSKAARMISGTQLSFYFGVGLFVSANSRAGKWGTGAIEAISEQLHRELPGLRGFSAQNVRNMRQFAEFWQPFLIHSPLASEKEMLDIQKNVDFDSFSLAKWSPLASEINSRVFHGVVVEKKAAYDFVERLKDKKE